MMANPQDREQHYGLGNLSDSILQHILSFLPTQEAVQTSILSRRWRYLWTEISTLNFNKRSPYNESLYTHKFVDGLFSALLCHKSKTLFKCQLLLCKNDGSIVFQAADHCILNAITKNVQELLITGTLVPYTLPATLFRHKSLQVLSLQGCNLGHAGSMDLRLLKDLRLTEVRAAYGMFQCLISSCQLLENLMFEGCSNMGDLLISLLHLRNLTIKYCHNLKTVQVEAPELRCFQFEGQLQKEFELHIAEIPSLIRADISFCCWLHVSTFDSIIKLTQFMGNFSPIKFLNLSAYYIEDLVLLGNGLDDEDNDDGGGDKDLMLATNLLEYLPPLLCNLKRLQLRGSFCSIKSIFVFATLLKMSPYLEELSLSLIPAVPKWPLDPSKTEFMDWKKLSINCLHHHLTTIEILQFEGDNIQNMLAKFLLGNGEVLEEVHIESTKALFSHHMKINKLLFSWRANPNTKIRYY